MYVKRGGEKKGEGSTPWTRSPFRKPAGLRERPANFDETILIVNISGCKKQSILHTRAKTAWVSISSLVRTVSG
jgi:hypothetical protein